MLKKRTYQGYVSPQVNVDELVVVTTDGKIEFVDGNGPYSDIGSLADWGNDEWPPKKLSITIEIID